MHCDLMHPLPWCLLDPPPSYHLLCAPPPVLSPLSPILCDLPLECDWFIRSHQIPIASTSARGATSCLSLLGAGVWLGLACWSSACYHDPSEFRYAASLLTQKTPFPCHRQHLTLTLCPPPLPWCLSRGRRGPTPFTTNVYELNPIWCRTFTLFGSLSPFSFFFLVSTCYKLSNTLL